MSFCREIRVKRTRKKRPCDWCGEKINQGDASVTTSGIFEGDFFSVRYHPECNAAAYRWYEANKCWGEEMPDGGSMNRGGIREKGELEETNQVNQ